MCVDRRRSSGRYVPIRVAIVVIGVLLAGCDSASSPRTEVGATPAMVTTVETTVVATVVTAPATTTIVPQPAVLAVTVSIGGDETSDEIVLDGATTSDPFGRFGTCSGVWRTFGAYNLLVSNPDPAIGSVQISTSANVRHPERSAATARIERGGGLFVSKGILDFGDDFSGGRFGGKTADGTDVEISFTCTGDRIGQPLDRTRQYVDVAALLTRDGTERIVSGAFEQPCTPGRVDVAPLSDDPYANGAISGLRLGPGELELRIGDSVLNFPNPTVTETDKRSGTFSGVTADGISVAGAYDCRQ